MIKSINIKGSLFYFDRPKVMGIVNATPDSFYAGSRTPGADALKERVKRMIIEGVDIIDVGGYSSRPGASDITAEEELQRLRPALEAIREIDESIPVSVDTFRANVAEECLEKWGVDIINDISGGDLDPEIWNVVAERKAPYILMHTRGTPETMQKLTDYTDVAEEVESALALKIADLRQLGVADVIVDPGFGFAKTTMQNFKLLSRLDQLHNLDCLILAGISRKTMIKETLGVTAEDALNGTTALNTIALMKGADILRVHDVREAKECVKLVSSLKEADKMKI